jgi:hypothetical protein
MRAVMRIAILATIVFGTCLAETMIMPIDDVFSPDMLWSDGQIIVLDGISDCMVGDEDCLCCEMIFDEFVGEVAVVDVRAVVRGPDHDYFIGQAWVGRVCVNDRICEIITEIVSEREEEEVEEVEENEADVEEGEEGE